MSFLPVDTTLHLPIPTVLPRIPFNSAFVKLCNNPKINIPRLRNTFSEISRVLANAPSTTTMLYSKQSKDPNFPLYAFAVDKTIVYLFTTVIQEGGHKKVEEAMILNTEEILTRQVLRDRTLRGINEMTFVHAQNSPYIVSPYLRSFITYYKLNETTLREKLNMIGPRYDFDGEELLKVNFITRLSVFEQLSQAYAYLESRQLTHNDGRLTNVLCNNTPEGIKVVLADCEYAKPVGEIQEGGCIDFMPPEVSSNDSNFTAHTSRDAWFLGILGLSLFTDYRRIFLELKKHRESQLKIEMFIDLLVVEPSRTNLYTPHQLPVAALIQIIRELMMHDPSQRLKASEASVRILEIYERLKVITP